MRRKIIYEEKLSRRLGELIQGERLSGGAALLVDLSRKISEREVGVESHRNKVGSGHLIGSCVNVEAVNTMLLNGHPLEVTNTQIAVGSSGEHSVGC